ncbi:alcohol dehydrogenase GroES-like domain-containing protein [Colletotrichum scovillei]|uniref:alcohol dehydrogenase GroES-like domain-containing protein n=1 Tax=Colletotrichum scovillei TaxID=1209932 RepID=UPI0015C360CB|nr:alcohol dehydrogenase GroES-like domain-containing protein [Colletotrichum scovillei]KAF4782192.1 alcohol dehydrogenase GroES-like domain-containing protein [Colletotrichum scovillei]
MTAPDFLPTTHKALKVSGPGHVYVSEDASVPSPGRSELLVRVACVSINQVDCKSADLSPTPGATSGTDFSGAVVALGSDVDAEAWNVGDRIMAGIFGNNPLRRDNGAFAEYAVVPARLAWKIPASMDLATAASLPAALATVGLSLFQYMKMAMPENTKGALQLGSNKDSAAASTTASSASYVLVYGGGTATGAMAIQVLKLMAARSLKLGAAATFDYRSPSCGADVLSYTQGALTLALDCISDSDSMSTCYKALGPAGGRYVALDPFPLRGHTRRSVEPDWVCCYTQFGHDVAWAPPFDLDARVDDRVCAEAWYVLAQRLLDEGLVVPQPLEVRRGGLAGVGEGMQEVRRGLIKGKKLVYSVAEIAV